MGTLLKGSLLISGAGHRKGILHTWVWWISTGITTDNVTILVLLLRGSQELFVRDFYVLIGMQNTPILMGHQWGREQRIPCANGETPVNLTVNTSYWFPMDNFIMKNVSLVAIIVATKLVPYLPNYNNRFEDRAPANEWYHNLVSTIYGVSVADVWQRYQTTHRPQKVYKHQHQREIRGNHKIGRAISREPNTVGCWNFERFYITWSFKEHHMVWNKRNKIPIKSLHNTMTYFTPTSMKMDFKISC